MKNALHRPLLPLALAAALTLSACSDGESATFEQSATQADDTAPETEAAGSDTAGSADTADAAGATSGAGGDAEDDVTEQSAAAAGVDPAQLGEPIATVTVPAVVEDDPEASMDVHLYSLRRDGETVVALFSFTVSSEDGSDDARWIYHYLGDTSWRPFLVDTTNLTRHDVLGSSGTRAMTDYQGVKFRPGQTLYAFAAFAAPPEGVDTVTVNIDAGAPAVAEVPIQ